MRTFRVSMSLKLAGKFLICDDGVGNTVNPALKAADRKSGALHYLPLLFVAFCLLPSSARAAVGFVQASGSSGAAGCISTINANCAANAFGSNVTSGDTLVVCGGWSLATGTGNSLSSVSDTLGTTGWTIVLTTKVTLASTNYTELGRECAYATATSTGADTVTCTFGLINQYKDCEAWDLNGVSLTSPVDKTSTGTGTTSTTISAGTVTTSVAGEVGIAGMEVDDGLGNATITAGTGWTLDYSNSGGNGSVGAQHQVLASAGNVTGSLTTNKTPNHWVASMLTFQPPGGGSGQPGQVHVIKPGL